jgi:hypothetical protein
MNCAIPLEDLVELANRASWLNNARLAADPDEVEHDEELLIQVMRRCLRQIDDANETDRHADEAAVDLFAAAMKAKLAKKRREGRGGWQDKDACPATHLQTLLLDHLSKGDPVDIGNFAMMLFNRGDRCIGPLSFSTRWHLDASASASLFHMAHPDDDGEHPELTLRLGHVRDEDGVVSYGLLCELADYPEEGADLLTACPAPGEQEGGAV